MRMRNRVSSILFKLYSISKPEAFHPSEHDVFLVSYPRSGNTWMRVVLAELLYGKSGNSLKDLDYYIPDIHYSRLKQNVINAEYHVIKSHSPFWSIPDKAIYRKVIYLVRDPRDVILSHYRYSKARGFNEDFEQFLLDSLTGRVWPTSWHEHVRSWTGPGIENKEIEICVIRYEDLLTEPKIQLTKIVDFMGLEISAVALDNVIQLASINSMKTKERMGLRDDENVPGMRFIGKAKSGQWKKFLSVQQVNLIKQYSGAEMKRFGY